MLRLGISLSFRGGREALARLLVIVAAVAVGTALLLTVLSLFHAYTTTVNRPCWQCTGQVYSLEDEPPPDGPVSTDAGPADLWNHTQDFYQGRVIERVDLAALGPDAPVVTGVPRLPAAGQYYASPALAALIASVPRDQLGERFPGTPVGTIGMAALAGPDDLAIIVGREPAQLAAQPNTIRVTTVHTAAHLPGSSNLYDVGFGLAAVALFVPMLVLIGNATRVAAARREERWAAMRLVGASSRQINLIASLDAAFGALGGAIIGILVFTAIRPWLDTVPVTGERFFADYITPTALGYTAVLIGTPVAAAAAAVGSLRRVRISPLGVARRTTPPAPRSWRIVPLAVGLVLFIAPLLASSRTDPNLTLAVPSLALIMVGLTLAGPWLAMRSARLLARSARGPASLLAARRMADNPKSSFRFVSGLVLAVFVGTALAGAIPAALAAQQTEANIALSNVLQVVLAGHGVPAAQGTSLTDALRAYPGTTLLPIYALPESTLGLAPDGRPPAPGGAQFGPPTTVVDCASLAALPVLGHCAPGVHLVKTNALEVLLTDNVANVNKSLPLVTPTTASATAPLSTLYLSAVLVKCSDPATLERIRTLLVTAYPGQTGGLNTAPQTFGEVASVRAAMYLSVQDAVFLVIILTLIAAAASLAIAVTGSIIERKRPFTLLRVSGATAPTLYRVVLLESLVPLLIATAAAGAAGLAVALPIGRVLTGGSPLTALPGGTYYLTLTAGLLVSLAVLIATMPIIGRVTVPAGVRFE